MTYDVIGRGYAAHRRPDPRIAALVHEALGGAGTVVNVGAGAGSYEPADRVVVAVEPSTVMLRQRPPSAAPAVQAMAEALPFPGDAFDAALVVLSVHHWNDRAAGYGELRRVARRRVVLTFDQHVHRRFWLIAEYTPEVAAMDDARGMTVAETAEAIGATRIVTVPLPHDCTDGVLPAHWRRPEAYLDPAVRAATSGLARLDAATTERMTTRLAADLASGQWHRRHADLLAAEAYDAGFRLLTTD